MRHKVTNGSTGVNVWRILRGPKNVSNSNVTIPGPIWWIFESTSINLNDNNLKTCVSFTFATCRLSSSGLHLWEIQFSFHLNFWIDSNYFAFHICSPRERQLLWVYRMSVPAINDGPCTDERCAIENVY